MDESISILNHARAPSSYRQAVHKSVRDACAAVTGAVVMRFHPRRSLLLKCFVIFGQGRSGSTLLDSLAGSHPEICCENELLRRRRPLPLQLPDTYTLRASYRGPHAFGFHLKPWHIDRVLRKEHHDFVRALDERGYRFIHLRRRTIFLQSVSQVRKIIYGIAHSRSARQRPSGRVVIDPEMLLLLMNEKADLRRLEEECLGQLSQEVLPLEYERDLQEADSHQRTCDRIFDFLDLPSHSASSPLKWTSSDDWRDGVENHAEIEQLLADHGFAELAGPRRV